MDDSDFDSVRIDAKSKRTSVSVYVDEALYKDARKLFNISKLLDRAMRAAIRYSKEPRLCSPRPAGWEKLTRGGSEVIELRKLAPGILRGQIEHSGRYPPVHWDETTGLVFADAEHESFIPEERWPSLALVRLPYLSDERPTPPAAEPHFNLKSKIPAPIIHPEVTLKWNPILGCGAVAMDLDEPNPYTITGRFVYGRESHEAEWNAMGKLQWPEKFKGNDLFDLRPREP